MSYGISIQWGRSFLVTIIITTIAMDAENPILKQFASLVPSACIVTVTDFSQTQIVFEIIYNNAGHGQVETGKVGDKKQRKSKLYKVKYDSDRKMQQIIQFLVSFSMRKIKVNSKNCQRVKQKVMNVVFEQVIIEKGVQLFQMKGIEQIKSCKYQILRQLPSHEICALYNRFHNSNQLKLTKSLQVQFEVEITEASLPEIVTILTCWVKLCQCEFQFQKLSLYRQGSQILSLQKNNQFGLSVCLHRFSNNSKLCLNILHQFIKCPIFVSIQFQDWQPSNVEVVDFVFKNYHHRNKYLIKLGNYLEITQLRLFINTTGMKKSEVALIFQLMKQPGHYELICHSNRQFFEETVNLFLYKPLINFKYFVPLTQVSQLQSAIDVMVQKADQLRKKIQVFMRMLKCPHKIDLSMIIQLFLSMSKTTVN